ncbi:CopD family protein [Mucilaginibacter sp. L3T2-6]|uniref:CopD family protein n=1 Tax=Mucilaginibacter sp. L3T2-6 TaxID=3062491 RepID=UPI0026771A07|nr:CopD family protein [Mucilaginibacter sp. L3T2-6]MDO3641934.1 CopD family protein [Mucilaginibacter sp. L3T2-6]MDV6214388.1 CopD family protein [Mucilaginibacter sp. L3T2-6]
MYDYILSIHIIFVVCWMAGLFYIVRLFVYHTEAQDKPEPERTILSQQFEVMERRLWNVISIPSMIITIAAGITMVCLKPVWLQMGWLQIKLGFVLGLVAYHHICQSKIKQMRNGIFKWTSTQLRLWNEVATIFLFAIVFLAVMKSAINWIYGVLGLLALAVILTIAVKIYKRYRTGKQ